MADCADCGHDERDHSRSAGVGYCITCKYNDRDCLNFMRKTVGT